MKREQSLPGFFTIRVPHDYTMKLEQARRALGARSLGEVIRIATDKLLDEVLNGASADKQR